MEQMEQAFRLSLEAFFVLCNRYSMAFKNTQQVHSLLIKIIPPSRFAQVIFNAFIVNVQHEYKCYLLFRRAHKRKQDNWFSSNRSSKGSAYQLSGTLVIIFFQINYLFILASQGLLLFFRQGPHCLSPFLLNNTGGRLCAFFFLIIF